MTKRLTVKDLENLTEEDICRLMLELASNSTGGSTTKHTPLLEASRLIFALGAKCAVIQRDVQDPDFLSEHAAYYSKWSAKIPRFCVRVHFFSASILTDDPITAVDLMASIDPSPYLGFVTLRPISTSPVAASILVPPNGPTTTFITSKDEFAVHIAGQRFTVTGTPFLQQDNAVGACAQASIWMALRTLRRREGHAALNPAQITTSATKFLVNGRTLPNRTGLTADQIIQAVRDAGFSPHLIKLRDPKKQATPDSIINAKKSLYPYVESGIPVILALLGDNDEGHAVLAIGHGWQQSPKNLSAERSLQTSSSASLDIYDASSWIEPFIIHNDNSGPYLPLNEFDPDTYALSNALFAIPLLPADVFIDGDEAREFCLELLGLALNKPAAVSKLVVRTYLQDRSVFRATVLRSDMSDKVKHYYRTKWLPRRIWVMEINELSNYGESPNRKSKRLGEIIIDPASEPAEGHFLSIHLSPPLLDNKHNGIIIDREAFNGEITSTRIDDHTYQPK